MADGFKLAGAEDIGRKMVKVGKRIAEKENLKAVRKALTPCVKKAKELAPVGEEVYSGLLQRSIGAKYTNKKGVARGVAGPMSGFRIRVGTRKKGKNKGQAIVKDPRRYAHTQEFGTSRHPAHPYLRPAWKAEGEEKALNTYQLTLSTGLDQTVKELR